MQAKRYGLPAGTIKDWEQKRRQPERAALVLLKVIDRAPDGAGCRAAALLASAARRA